MAGDDNEADLFAIPHFWQTSKWLGQLDQSESFLTSSFFGQDLQDASGFTESGLGALAPIVLEQDGFFKLPAFDIDRCEEQNTTSTSDEVDATPDTTIRMEHQTDLWMELKETPSKATGYRTWDSFLTGRPTNVEPTFITEAGPTAYDALLCLEEDPLKLENSDVPVIQTKAYFSALLSLALGSESVFFSRHPEARTFKPTLTKMRISGYSRNSLRGIESECLSCGITFLKLQSFAQSAYSAHSSRCGVALASALNQVLHAVQERVVVHGRNPRSLLRLQSTIRDISAILNVFGKLISQIRPEHTDREVMSLVFRQAYEVDGDEQHLRGIMRELLRRVSVPWAEFVEEWIGTKPEEGIPLTKSDAGQSKGFVTVQPIAYTDDFGRDIEELDFRLDDNKVPKFMPDDMTESIFETGRNLRFIKSFHPDHPLAQPAVIASSKPPKAEWLYDWESILQLEERVSHYRDNLLDAIRESRLFSSRPPTRGEPLVVETGSVFKLNVFGIDQAQMEEQILASIGHLNQPMASSKAEDLLSRLVRERLNGTYDAVVHGSDSTPHWSLLPTLSFGGIVSAQASIVNKETLRLLFQAHDLRGHLRLQRDFQLLGNGVFCSRLSHALFDPELESAERQAGVARQGGVMGLRLGGRDTWPPASSELRLALMGVLAESYNSEASTVFGDFPDLPGDLSFAVRDLSPEEIDKCMNPDSLEALDFLRLSYTTPQELNSVITPVSLTQYDTIFKLLLRVLRMIYVTNQLFRDVNSSASHWNAPGNASYRFVREAQHFVSSIAAYFLDTGVGLSWQAFEKKMDGIEAYLNGRAVSNEPDQPHSPDELREFHTQMLDQIVLALFLRKRQAPVLKLLEDIFSCVLLFAKYSRLQALGRGDETDASHEPTKLYSEFRKKVQVFITVCRGLTEKGRSARKRMQDMGSNQPGIGDESMVAQLLMKLDMNDYYCQR